MQEFSTALQQTRTAQDASRSTQSTSNLSESGSSEGSNGFVNPEYEGDCVVEYTIKVKGFGRYEKVEQSIAHTLAVACYRSFDEDAWELTDEIGRRIVFDSKAPFGSLESVRFVDKPT